MKDLIKNKHLKAWIQEKYPAMSLSDDKDLCELDYLDMDAFADWLTHKLVRDHSQKVEEWEKLAPKKEKYGWYDSEGFDDEPSGWLIEGGEEAFEAAYKEWLASKPKKQTK